MDKHSLNAKEYPCEYPPCGYKSKRESNCKQHMEKAHDYVYVRTKSNKKKGPKPQPTKVDRAKQSRAKKLSGVVDTAPVYTQQEVTSPMLPAQRIMDEQIPEEHQYANPQGLALPTTPRQYNEEHSFTDLLTASLTDYAGSPSQYFVPNDPMLPMMFTYSQGEDVIPNGTYTENGLNTPIYDFSQEWS